MARIKPKVVTKPAEPVPAPPHLVDFHDSPALRSFQKASDRLAGINGGFQRFVVAKPDGTFVPVVMLLPSECTPDIIGHVRRLGAHVMAGVSSEHLILEGGR